MIEGTQGKLLSNLNDVEIVRILLADLHDDLDAKVARFHQLADPHFRAIDDPSQLSRRVLDSKLSAQENLLSDATFAISVAVRLLALPKFRLEN